jgi:hypothetical protein
MFKQPLEILNPKSSRSSRPVMKKPPLFCILGAFLFMLCTPALAGQPALPGWWTDTVNGTAIISGNANNFAPLTIGQLKFAAIQARAYLDAQLAPIGGAGPDVDAVVNSFELTDPNDPELNHHLANLGQLKYVAKPFYDRLMALGYNTTASISNRIYYGNFAGHWTSSYPWPTPPAAPGQTGYSSAVYNAWMQLNYAPANLGQIKLVFSFDLSANNTVGFNLDSVTGRSAAQTAWLQHYFTTAQLGNPAVSGDLATPANDGIPNLIKYALNLNPLQNGQSLLPIPQIVNGQLILTFQATQSDLTYTVQASTNLIDWSANGVTTKTNGTQVTASYSLPASGQAFLRLQVTSLP